MMDEATFGLILASLHETALDPARWPGFSAVVDEALGVQGGSLMFGDGESSDDARIAFFWICTHGERRRDLEHLYHGTYYALDERVPRLRHAPDGRLFHNTEVFTEQELKTSPAQDAFRRFNCGNAMNVRLDGPRGSRIMWMVHDPIRDDAWSSAQLDAIRRLLPHLRLTVRVQVALGRAGTLGMTLESLLEATGVGVIQLDRRARIVAANDRARGLLRAGDVLYDTGGCLFAHVPTANAELQDLLGRALPPFGIPAAGGTMIARRPSGPPPLVLHVIPVGGGETEPGAWPVAALVLVPDAAQAADLDVGAVADTLHFTRAESQVAVLLARGMTVREVAAATGRGDSTVRSHVKHMFAKQGLTRQADLVRLVRSLVGAHAGAPGARGTPEA
ncbi:MAG: helix-turn-helix transcriptional regulator [Gammaproteobacteria bacterium]|nr:helix-turn-helix transcriptional regulator [Gammaproteobacteria bacterium]MYF29538.1 helix-turn-helix transcriptional regulator [Gammaproteobacteria bacterium]MYK48227.1 helix-turn-helix transcriptional regulator [Gammaproteobacteria bacterium]